MAAEISPISEITDGNQDLHAEMHEALRILREIEVVLSRFRPLLDQVITSPLATRRAMRRAGRDAIP